MKNINLKSLRSKHFYQKLDKLSDFKGISVPSTGWINYFRTCLNMTQRQMAKILNISQPGVKSLENSEKNRRITIESLKKTADVFDCDLVYAFVPRKNMDSFITKHAKEAAKKDMLAVDHTMALENQNLSKKDMRIGISNYAKELKNSISKKLWD